MIPVKQLYRHDPANNQWGDCHRAAIASILELPTEQVCHFGDGGPDNREFDARVEEWLWYRDLIPIHVFYDADLNKVLAAVRAANPDIYYLLGGTSRNNVNHTVVCLNDAIVHDPSLDNSGICGPLDNGFYCITYFGSILARKGPA